MPRVSLNQPAPDFSLPDFSGTILMVLPERGCTVMGSKDLRFWQLNWHPKNILDYCGA